MSKVWKVIVGLFFDDARLAGILLLALIISIITTKAGFPLLGMLCIWGGLVIALFISIEHQFQLKIRAQKNGQK